MKFSLRLLPLLFVFLASAPAQQLPTSQFSAASIKAHPADGRWPTNQFGPVRFVGGGSLVNLMRTAWQVTDVFGGPTWARDEGFEVEATAGVPVSTDAIRSMLRSLLTERFALRFHTERRSLPGYLLVLKAPTTPKLTRHDNASKDERHDQAGRPEASPISVIGQLHLVIGRNATMAQLAAALGSALGIAVDDGTDLSGNFDFQILYNPDFADHAIAPDLMDKVLATPKLADLGLALIPRKLDREVLVIESAGRPTAN